MPNVKMQQDSVIFHKEENVPAYLIVVKNIQKNPLPSYLKGSQASVDILGATECPPKYEARRM